MKIRPRAKQILVKPDSAEPTENEFGLLRPENEEQEQKAIGTVLAVGESITDIKVGDRVIHGAYVGEKIKLRESGSDVDYILLFDEDVLAFLDES